MGELDKGAASAFDAAGAYQACVDATRAFVYDAGVTDVVIGLSGGLDSSLVATIACDALGASHVHGVQMESPFTSVVSTKDATDLAENLGISTSLFPITDLFATFSQDWEVYLGEPLKGLAAENTQARLRMCILMALSNVRGWMVLNTGNRSEACMGYSTLYGDTAGAFAPIGGLFKTEVYALARFANERACARGMVAPIPANVLVKPPSAELSSGQTDEASLGVDYPTLDAILGKVLDAGYSEQETAQQVGCSEDTVHDIMKRYAAYAYKRALEPSYPAMEAFRHEEQ